MTAKLLDDSIAADGYIIAHDPPGPPYDAGGRLDLSRLDLAALKARFEQGRKHTAAEQLKGVLSGRVRRMAQLNRSRADYLERLQRLIDDYNSGALNVELFFQRLVAFTAQLDEEDRRALAEGLTEEELAIFDLLTKPDPHLTEQETKAVKTVARDLLGTLKQGKLVLDWRKHQQSRARVLTAIKDVLDRDLPATYTTALYERKCASVYQHIYDSYYGEGQSIYGPAA